MEHLDQLESVASAADGVVMEAQRTFLVIGTLLIAIAVSGCEPGAPSQRAATRNRGLSSQAEKGDVWSSVWGWADPMSMKASEAEYTYEELDAWGDVAADQSPVSRYIREVSLNGRWDRVFIGIDKRRHRTEVIDWLEGRIPRDGFRVRRVGIPVIDMGSPWT
jgi:hypothetical protein